MKTETDRWEDDGGPAFPGPQAGGLGEDWKHFPGLTIRDWFAGQALSGVTANNEMLKNLARLAQTKGRDQAEYLCDFCYGSAESMLRAREHGDE